MDRKISRRLLRQKRRLGSDGKIERSIITRTIRRTFLPAERAEKTRKQSSALSLPIAAQDVQATLVEFTVRTIADNLKNIDTPLAKRLLVCGGGVKNRLMMQRLAEHLTPWQISTTRDFGLDPDYVEAAAFAWLAYRRMHNQSGNVPEVTGAQKAISLGAIFPKP